MGLFLKIQTMWPTHIKFVKQGTDWTVRRSQCQFGVEFFHSDLRVCSTVTLPHPFNGQGPFSCQWRWRSLWSVSYKGKKSNCLRKVWIWKLTDRVEHDSSFSQSVISVQSHWPLFYSSHQVNKTLFIILSLLLSPLF